MLTNPKCFHFQVAFFFGRIRYWICDLRSYDFFMTKKLKKSWTGSFNIKKPLVCKSTYFDSLVSISLLLQIIFKIYAIKPYLNCQWYETVKETKQRTERYSCTKDRFTHVVCLESIPKKTFRSRIVKSGFRFDLDRFMIRFWILEFFLDSGIRIQIFEKKRTLSNSR